MQCQAGSGERVGGAGGAVGKPGQDDRPAGLHPPVRPGRARFGDRHQPVRQHVSGLRHRRRTVGYQDQQDAGVAGDDVGVPRRIGRRAQDPGGNLRHHLPGASGGGRVIGYPRPGAQRRGDAGPPGEQPVVGQRGHPPALAGKVQQPVAGTGRDRRRVQPGRHGLGAAEQHPGRPGVETVGRRAALKPAPAAPGLGRDRPDPVECTPRRAVGLMGVHHCPIPALRSVSQVSGPLRWSAAGPGRRRRAFRIWLAIPTGEPSVIMRRLRR